MRLSLRNAFFCYRIWALKNPLRKADYPWIHAIVLHQYKEDYWVHFKFFGCPYVRHRNNNKMRKITYFL